MALEQIFAPKWLERKPAICFLLGFVYSELGILSALIVFPKNAGLMSIAFTSILLIPALNSLLSLEENQEREEKRTSLRALFKNHKDIFQIYAYLFLGILLSFAIFSIFLDKLTTVRLFDSQLAIIGITGKGQVSGFFGQAISSRFSPSFPEFVSILANNFKVLLVCLVFSLVYGAGSILFLTWNASVWGTIFGYIARTAAEIEGHNPLAYFGMTFLTVLPHTLAEASSYFIAVIAGGVISKAVIREKLGSNRFNHVVVDGLIFFILALIILVIAAYLEVYVFPYLSLIR